MYRFWLFVCYCFLSWPNLFEAHSWTGLNLNPFPTTTESGNMSLLTFPPSFRVSSSSPQHLISCLRFPVMSFHKAPCRSEAFGQALLWGDDTVSGPEYFGSQTHTEGQGLITLSQPKRCILDLLSTAQRQNGSKLFTELGSFLTCSMEM